MSISTEAPTMFPAGGEEVAHGHRGKARMNVLLAAMIILTGPLAASGFAEIKIQTAEIEHGELIIGGTVRPRTEDVVLAISPDQAITVTTDPHGRFIWHGSEFPPTCTVEVRAGDENKIAVIRGCGPLNPGGASAQNGKAGQSEPSGRHDQHGITGIYVVRKACWLGPQAPAQVPPTPPPLCEITCNPNDFFLSAACGEGEILGPADHPTGFKCRAFATSIVCGRH